MFILLIPLELVSPFHPHPPPKKNFSLFKCMSFITFSFFTFMLCSLIHLLIFLIYFFVHFSDSNIPPPPILFARFHVQDMNILISNSRLINFSLTQKEFPRTNSQTVKNKKNINFNCQSKTLVTLEILLVSLGLAL